MTDIPRGKEAANKLEAFIEALNEDVNRAALEPWLKEIFEPIVSYTKMKYLIGQ